MAYTDNQSVQTMWTADTILEFIHQKREILRGMGIRQIGLFGSYVRGEQRPDSDIDLLFSMDKISFTRWMDAWNFLEDQLGTEVDLIPEQDLRTELRDSVLSEVRYVKNL